MRKIQTLVLGIALGLPLLAGCYLFNPRKNDAPINVPTTPDKQPTATSLVNYLNLNAKRIQSVRASLDIDAKQGIQSLSISGGLAARRPRELRLRGKVVGTPVVDVGSNDKQFWYWIGKTKEDYYYSCSYQELATGKINVPFPVEADMVMAALNMAEYDVKGKYDLKQTKDAWELIQDTTSAAGQPVKRVTVFRGTLARPGEPQVLEHSMRDAKNNLVCRATVQKVEVVGGAVIPTKVAIEWPAQKVKMTLMLSSLEVNKITDAESARIFSLEGVGKEVYDLARGGVTPSSQRRAAAETRRR
jgi:hypothetical protein